MSKGAISQRLVGSLAALALGAAGCAAAHLQAPATDAGERVTDASPGEPMARVDVGPRERSEAGRRDASRADRPARLDGRAPDARTDVARNDAPRFDSPRADAAPAPDRAPPPADMGTPADAAVEPCDPMGDPTYGNVCGGASSKCAYVIPGSSSSGLLECVTPGSAGADSPCTRPTGEPGIDNCQAGLFCSGLGEPYSGGAPVQRTCRAYCRSDFDCNLTQQCALFEATYTPAAGLCEDTCTFLGSDCASGTTCNVTFNIATAFGGGATSPQVWQPICAPNGTLTVGSTCDPFDYPQDCVASSACFLRKCDASHACPGGDACNIPSGSSFGVCTHSSRCQAFCDSSHPCPGGAACEQLDGLAAGQGYCLSY